MKTRYATLISPGACVEQGLERFPELFRLARTLCPDGFPAEETRELDALYDHVPFGFAKALRRDVAGKLGLPEEIMPLDLFSIHGAGPVSLHDDKHNYPGVYFILIVVHSGRLGIADSRSQAHRHDTGEILLLDPHRKHALVPEGLRARQHAYERTHGPVSEEQDQFMFFCFDVKRSLLRHRFRQT
jgi:hypothetical protein